MLNVNHFATTYVRMGIPISDVTKFVFWILKVTHNSATKADLPLQIFRFINPL